MSSGLDPAFVGRRRELATLGELLHQADGGTPRLHLIQGPAGIGKTALVRRFLHDAKRPHVLYASGDEAETALPYGLLSRLVVLPDHFADPFAAGASLLAALGQAQDGTPVVAVVDDAQWGDPPSLQAIAFALRRLRHDRVLAIVVTRDLDDLPEGLLRALDGPQAGRTALTGLDSGELARFSAQLGGPRLGRRAAQRLHAHTSGNPLHVRTLLEEVPERALTDAEGPLPAPRSYALLVLRRLAKCGPQAQSLVQAAAVLGTSCPLHLAADLAELRAPLPLLEQACTAGLLAHRPGPDGLAVEFAHPLVHASIYQSLLLDHRRRLHLAAAGLVRDENLRLAHRVRAADRPDADLARDLAHHGRGQAARGLWSSAATHLVNAARSSEHPGDQALLATEAVTPLLMAGRIEEAQDLAASIPAAAPAGLRSYALGHVASVEGDTIGALALLDQAWKEIDPDCEPQLSARTAQQLAMLALMTARGADAARWADRALALLPHDTDPDLTVSIAITGLCFSGGIEEALARTAALPDSSVASAGELSALLGRGLARTVSDDLDGAVADLSRVAAARERSLPFRLLATALLGQAEYRAGLWDDALVHTEAAASIADDAGQGWLAPICHALAALVPAARGDWERAENHVRIARERLGRASGIASLAHTAAAGAALAGARGDPAGVIAACAPLLDLDVHDIVHEPGVVLWHDLLVDALIAVGEHDRAQTITTATLRLASQRRRHSVLAAMERCRGALLAARHDLGPAGQAYQSGLRHAEASGNPYLLARTRLDFGAFLRRAGHRRSASHQLTSAHTALTGMCAAPLLERCNQELAACGRARPSGAPAERYGFTTQEQAVIRLAVRGLTNGQIARELVLSVKTIEFHLTNVYAKVGVTSRVALTAKLAETRAT
ncbi:ATP-binding protein [Sphaerisporangium rhizosphaerae]|uniref:ATP-binding protein n=1 Tax=Sphaerisporangium rhizosphaerae TaxID=2269375 RepID=A0ABW2PFD7_9ACTN